MGGHSMSDPGTSYRTRDDVKKVREERDCVAKFTERLIGEGVATAEELKQMEKAAVKACDEEIAQGEASPDTPPQELYTDIFHGDQYPIRAVEGIVQP
eukprot:NODE_8593_length_403_cov_46.621469_g7714_i0.p2 GENE.NODE_8593_length_403_cov_46.621469_g7714_i0~~NODE_8593_length_403_cov_46.621469_g7714_i0.p2  ORF type:complete len:106 (+),score=43.90 NODE_8593_length_403_cov_46.621469_g7714_i0:26-319(+)